MLLILLFVHYLYLILKLKQEASVERKKTFAITIPNIFCK